MEAQSIKEKILQEIMDLMDEKSVDGLKASSPKFGMAKVDVTATDPKMADSIKAKLMGGMDGESAEDECAPMDEAKESPMDEMKEKMSPMADDGGGMGKDSDDDLERLKELYAKLK